ncbi:MAG: hypothetical protein IJT53_03660 [Prevotella sp.]|nr:hypothetical protein [Prevotella sp.]
MKKQYINPVLTVINVQTQQMIAESAGFGSGTKGGGEAVSRRGYNVWDDEDEFDSEE